MCYSAAASFTAGAILAGAGLVSLRHAGTGAERPLAAIPLIFSVQQAIEGLVWLSFDWGDPAVTRALGQGYTLFSHVLWPAYVPLATWLAEPRGPRKAVLGGAAVAGILLAAMLAWSLTVDPVTPTPAGGHVAYQSRQLFGPAAMLLYLAATTGTLMASSHGFLRLFGASALAAFALAYLVYARWFVSVWCFFAAWLSAVLLLHFVARSGAARRRALA